MMDEPEGPTARDDQTARSGGSGTELLLAAAGLLLAVLSMLGAPARTESGALGGLWLLGLALVAALTVTVVLARLGARRAGLWLSLAIFAQAVSLQLIEAGPTVRYQHFLPWNRLGEAPVAQLLFLAFAMLVVAAAVVRRAAELRRWLEGQPKWRWLVLLGALALSSATVSRDPLIYAGELVLASALQAVALATVLLFAFSLPAELVDRWRRRVDDVLSGGEVDAGPRIDRFALLCGVWVAVVASALAIFSYQRHPHIPDEVVYLLQARYYAAGMIEMPAPPVREAFDLDLMTYESERWYSPLPPGWPAMLAVGVVLGVPWLVNPVLAGCALLLAYRLIWSLFDRRTARIAALILCASPWFVFLAMSYMNHTFGWLCSLAAALLVHHCRTTGRLWSAICGGLLIGFIGLNRPLDAVVLGGLMFLWLVRPDGRWRPGSVVALTLAAIAGGAVVFPYNRHFTGDPLTLPLKAYFDHYHGPGLNDMGFGPDRGLGWTGLDPFPGHGPIDVLINGNLNNFSINIELLGWAAGSLLPTLALVLLGRLGRRDLWMLLAIGVVVGLYSLYWFSGGPDFGARYWYLVLIPFVALTARAVEQLSRLDGGTRLLGAAAALSLSTLICFFPWRATDKYYRYRNMRPDVRELASELEPNSLVLVRGRRHPDYPSAAIYNPIDLQQRAPIFVWDRDDPALRAELERAFPGRRILVLDGPTLTGDGYRLGSEEVSETSENSLK